MFVIICRNSWASRSRKEPRNQQFGTHDSFEHKASSKNLGLLHPCFTNHQKQSPHHNLSTIRNKEMETTMSTILPSDSKPRIENCQLKVKNPETRNKEVDVTWRATHQLGTKSFEYYGSFKKSAYTESLKTTRVREGLRKLRKSIKDTKNSLLKSQQKRSQKLLQNNDEILHD